MAAGNFVKVGVVGAVLGGIYWIMRKYAPRDLSRYFNTPELELPENSYFRVGDTVNLKFQVTSKQDITARVKARIYMMPMVPPLELAYIGPSQAMNISFKAGQRTEISFNIQLGNALNPSNVDNFPLNIALAIYEPSSREPEAGQWIWQNWLMVSPSVPLDSLLMSTPILDIEQGTEMFTNDIMFPFKLGFKENIAIRLLVGLQSPGFDYKFWDIDGILVNFEANELKRVEYRPTTREWGPGKSNVILQISAGEQSQSFHWADSANGWIKLKNPPTVEPSYPGATGLIEEISWWQQRYEGWQPLTVKGIKANEFLFFMFKNKNTSNYNIPHSENKMRIKVNDMDRKAYCNAALSPGQSQWGVWTESIKLGAGNHDISFILYFGSTRIVGVSGTLEVT